MARHRLSLPLSVRARTRVRVRVRVCVRLAFAQHACLWVEHFLALTSARKGNAPDTRLGRRHVFLNWGVRYSHKGLGDEMDTNLGDEISHSRHAYLSSMHQPRDGESA